MDLSCHLCRMNLSTLFKYIKYMKHLISKPILATLLLTGSTLLQAAPMTDTTANKLIQLAEVQTLLKNSQVEAQPLFKQQAEALLKNALATETLDAKQQQAANQISQLMANLSKQIIDNPEFLNMIKQSYQRTYSEEEAQAYIAFLSTPQGQSINRKSPELMKLVMQQSTALSDQISNDPQQQEKFMKQLNEIIQPLLKKQSK